MIPTGLATSVGLLLIGGPPPAAERTLVVCGKEDENDVKSWAKAVYGADGHVLALVTARDFLTKVNQARNTSGKPMTSLLIFPSERRVVDREDGSIKYVGGADQVDLASLPLTGFKKVQIEGRVCVPSTLAAIMKALNVDELSAWTLRHYTTTIKFPIKPPRPNTPDDRLKAAKDLLGRIRKNSSGNHRHDKFLAPPLHAEPALGAEPPLDEALLADRLKGARDKFDVVFEWFGSSDPKEGASLNFNPLLGADHTNLGEPRLKPVDRPYRLTDAEKIPQRSCPDGILQRWVITRN